MTSLRDKLKKIDENIKLNELHRRLLEYKGSDRVISSHEKLEEIQQSQKDKPKFHLKTQIPLLDKYFDGIRLGTVNVVSGPTGEGKSTWLQTLTGNFAEQGINSVWFTFEVMPEEFFEKFNGNVPLFYLPKEIPESQNTLQWLKERIIEAQAKYDVKVVFIDHLHYLQDMQGLAGKDHQSLYIGDLMRKLKRMSIDLELVIFLIVHVKTDAGNQAEVKKYFTKDDIRDSSFVKQEADSVMMIWRKREKTQTEVGWAYTQNAVLNLDKHRRTGKVGFVKLTHSEGKFQELAGYDL